MSTSREKLQQARELIQAKRYDEARVILRTVNHDTAFEWLDKLDKLDPPQAAKPKRKQRPILALLLLILAICILGAGIAYIRSTTQAADRALSNAVEDLDKRTNYCSTYCRAINGGTLCADTCMKGTPTPTP